MNNRKKRYSNEFKAQVLSYLALSENMRATAKLYNISPSTVFYWKNSDKKPENHEVVESHSDATYEYKIKVLQAKIYQLEEENLILRKAAKIFASAS